MKKLNYEEIKKYIEIQNYTLLTTKDKYIDTNTKVDLLCPKGHQYSVIVYSFKNGRRCSVCKGLESTIRQRTPYEKIIEKVNEAGFILITTKEEYELNFPKIDKYIKVLCGCGNVFKIEPTNLKTVRRCKNCANKLTGDRYRLDFNIIKNFVESIRGFTLISNSCNSIEEKLNVRCNENHVFFASYASMKGKNSGCPDCKAIKCSRRLKFSYSKLIELAKLKNINILMAKEDYYNTNFKGKVSVSAECIVCNYKFFTSAAKINSGRGCKMCGFKKIASQKTKTYEQAKKEVKALGYELITPFYTGTYQKLEIKCSKHGIFISRLNDISNGHICRKCAIHAGKTQTEIFNFVKQFYPNSIENDRTLIKPKELDIYIPELNFAIEFCGLIHHSKKYRKDEKVHLKKRELCNDKGIELLQIYEDEWKFKQPIVKDIILHKLGINKIQLYARKLILKDVKNKDAQIFLEGNHLMGKYVPAKYIGLYDGNELVSLMGFKFKNKTEVDISRFCNKIGYSVVGGLSKLINHIEKTYKPKKILYWIDLRYGNIKNMEKLGFKLEKVTLGWKWTNFRKTFNRLYCRANMDERNLSEENYAKELKLYKIYDAGQAKMTKTNYGKLGVPSESVGLPEESVSFSLNEAIPV